MDGNLACVHATSLGASPSDFELWAVAAAQNLVIVTKDADFADRMMLADPPPRVVHLRMGNMRLKAFRSIVSRTWPRVSELLEKEKLVLVFEDRIECVGSSD